MLVSAEFTGFGFLHSSVSCTSVSLSLWERDGHIRTRELLATHKVNRKTEVGGLMSQGEFDFDSHAPKRLGYQLGCRGEGGK